MKLQFAFGNPSKGKSKAKRSKKKVASSRKKAKTKKVGKLKGEKMAKKKKASKKRVHKKKASKKAHKKHAVKKHVKKHSKRHSKKRSKKNPLSAKQRFKQAQRQQRIAAKKARKKVASLLSGWTKAASGKAPKIKHHKKVEVVHAAKPSVTARMEEIRKLAKERGISIGEAAKLVSKPKSHTRRKKAGKKVSKKKSRKKVVRRKKAKKAKKVSARRHKRGRKKAKKVHHKRRHHKRAKMKLNPRRRHHKKHKKSIFGRNPMAKFDSVSKTYLGVSTAELTALAAGGALVPVVNGAVKKFMPAAVTTINSVFGPQAAGSVLPILVGAGLNALAEHALPSGQAKQYTKLAGEGLASAGIVGLMMSLSQRYVAPAMGLGAVIYSPDFRGINYTPMHGINYTPMSGYPQLGDGYTESHKFSKADFGRGADFGEMPMDADVDEAMDPDQIHDGSMAGSLG